MEPLAVDTMVEKLRVKVSLNTVPAWHYGEQRAWTRARSEWLSIAFGHSLRPNLDRPVRCTLNEVNAPRRIIVGAVGMSLGRRIEL
jgi:hypothetical protein